MFSGKFITRFYVISRRSGSIIFTKKNATNKVARNVRNFSDQTVVAEAKTSRWANWTGKNSYKSGLIMLSLSGFGSLMYVVYSYGPPPKDEEGKLLHDPYADWHPLLAYPCRSYFQLMSFSQSIKDPVSEKLLPDKLAPPYQPPYTLVIEMTDLLVHPEWTFRTGWRYKKRAALELFLSQVAPYYEIVLFTNEPPLNSIPILQQLDPQNRFISFQLFREATRYENGAHIKDLQCLNRGDLTRVVLVDWQEASGKLQPRNHLRIRQWQGDDSDRELIDLAAFLRMIALNKIDDVRSVLDHYGKFDNPMAEFREKQEILMDEQKKRRDQLKQKAETIDQRRSLLSAMRR